MILQSTGWKNTKTENRQIVNWKKGLPAIVFNWGLKWTARNPSKLLMVRMRFHMPPHWKEKLTRYRMFRYWEMVSFQNGGILHTGLVLPRIGNGSLLPFPG